MTDWIEVLKAQRKEGRRMEREATKLLANPAILPDQAKALFDALEQQAVFVEKLRKVLDGAGYEPDVVKNAELLEDLYADLAAKVAERVKAMSRLPNNPAAAGATKFP